MIDVLGFIGSGLIIVSLTMKSIVRLRVIGLAGALVFIAYGVWLGAWPVVATNMVTFSIHVARLRDLNAERSSSATDEPATTPSWPEPATSSSIQPPAPVA